MSAPGSMSFPSAEIRPDVSVVIPAYRAQSTIEAAIASALDQKGVEVEVVVVEDASPDSTALIVERMAEADPRIRLLRQPRNAGVGAARNRALDAARGRWIALLDADDRFAPGRLARLIRVAQEDGADMVADNMVLVGPLGEQRGHVFRMDRLDMPEPLDAPTFVRGNVFLKYGYTLGYLKPLIRAEVLDRGIRFLTDMPVAEDFHFYLDCLLAGARWRLVPEGHYYYTVTPGSLSRSLSMSDMEAIRRRSLEAVGKASALGRTDVVRAMKERHRTIELMIGHMRFVEALKSGAAAEAFGLAIRRPQLLPYIFKFGLESAQKRIVRLRQPLVG